MDSSNQAPDAAEGANTIPQAQPQQQQLAPLDANGAGNGIAHLPLDLSGQFHPNVLAAAGILPDGSFITNPAMSGLPMPDPSLLMQQMMMANGNATEDAPPSNSISAGMLLFTLYPLPPSVLVTSTLEEESCSH